MSKARTSLLSRRRMLTGLTAGVAGGALALQGGLARSRKGLRSDEHDQALAERKLLFVVTALGGGSIIDSFLPVVDSEVQTGSAAALNVYPESMIRQPQGSAIRCVGRLSDYSYFTSNFAMEDFLANHYADVCVLGHEVTSVNHNVAQHRSLTGAGVDQGRTIMEAQAERHGAGLLLPNCNMASQGYVMPGTNADIPHWARAEIIPDPLMFAAATHGHRGVLSGPDAALIDRARGVRSELEGVSPFGQTFRNSEMRQRFLETRDGAQRQIEAADLISKLMLIPQDNLPPEYGLEASPLIEPLLATFPSLYTDPWEARAALGFAMAYFGVSCSVTLGVSFDLASAGSDIISTPLAFDYSHTDHRVAQNLMWNRITKVLDGLVTLLKTYDYLGDSSLGKMWDRSLIYVATDFGRDKRRPNGSSSWGTGHHLNNGSLLISPMVRGNRVFGGVDPDTLLTYGFDRSSGDPEPDMVMREGDVYSAVAQALDIDFTGRRNMSAVLRG